MSRQEGGESPPPTFFISTGRCGTRFLAGLLSKTWGDRAVVTHEFAHWSTGLDLFLPDSKTMKDGLDLRDGVIKNRLYVETNHSFMKYWAKDALERWPDLRVVILLRDPVEVGISGAATMSWPGQDGEGRRWYFQPLTCGIPWDPTWTIEQKHHWNWLGTYKKALEFVEENDVPYHTFSFSKINDTEHLADLINFIEPADLPPDQPIFQNSLNHRKPISVDYSLMRQWLDEFPEDRGVDTLLNRISEMFPDDLHKVCNA